MCLFFKNFFVFFFVCFSSILLGAPSLWDDFICENSNKETQRGLGAKCGNEAPPTKKLTELTTALKPPKSTSTTPKSTSTTPKSTSTTPKSTRSTTRSTSTAGKLSTTDESTTSRSVTPIKGSSSTKRKKLTTQDILSTIGGEGSSSATTGKNVPTRQSRPTITSTALKKRFTTHSPFTRTAKKRNSTIGIPTDSYTSAGNATNPFNFSTNSPTTRFTTDGLSTNGLRHRNVTFLPTGGGKLTTGGPTFEKGLNAGVVAAAIVPAVCCCIGCAGCILCFWRKCFGKKGVKKADSEENLIAEQTKSEVVYTVGVDEVALSPKSKNYGTATSNEAFEGDGERFADNHDLYKPFVENPHAGISDVTGEGDRNNGSQQESHYATPFPVCKESNYNPIPEDDVYVDMSQGNGDDTKRILNVFEGGKGEVHRKPVTRGISVNVAPRAEKLHRQ